MIRKIYLLILCVVLLLVYYYTTSYNTESNTYVIQGVITGYGDTPSIEIFNGSEYREVTISEKIIPKIKSIGFNRESLFTIRKGESPIVIDVKAIDID